MSVYGQNVFNMICGSVYGQRMYVIIRLTNYIPLLIITYVRKPKT